MSSLATSGYCAPREEFPSSHIAPSTECRRPSGGSVLVLLLVLFCGCGRRQPPLVDLVEAFDKAAVRHPTTEIDFGRASAFPLLVSGWLDDPPYPIEPDRRVGAYSLGSAAEVEFFAAPSENVALEFKAMRVPNAGDQLEVLLDGRSLGAAGLTTQLEVHRFGIPGAALSMGWHRLRFDHSSTPVRRQPLKDVRAVWEWLRFKGMRAAPDRAAAVDRARARLELSGPVRVDYFLELPGGTRLEAAAVTCRLGNTLDVAWQALDAAAPGEVAARRWRGEPVDLAIPAGRLWRGRLSFTADSETPGGSAENASIVIERPALRGPRSLPPADSPSPASALRASKPPLRPNIVLYMVDALRKDHLGCYGYSRPTSPHLDRFAADAVLFEDALAQSSWTRPSVASILTGLWPQNHRAMSASNVLPNGVDTLQERLRAAGYRSAAFTANGNAGQMFGFDQGFDHFSYLEFVRPGEPLARSTDVQQAVVSWMDRRANSAQPFFLWILSVDPHSPYRAPEPYHSLFARGRKDATRGSVERLIRLALQEERVPAGDIEEMVDLYDAEVRANDESFGALLEELRRRGLYDRTIVVFVSDHGEEFCEHGGWEHGRTLFSEVLGVPLVIRVPGMSRGSRRPELVEQVDLMPTLLDLAGVHAGGPANGRSLKPLLSGAAASWPSVASLAHLDYRGRAGVSVVEGDWKLIMDSRQGVVGYPRLYYRPADPNDQHDVSFRHRERAYFMRARLSQLLLAGQTAPLPSATPDPAGLREIEEHLRALGYVR